MPFFVYLVEDSIHASCMEQLADFSLANLRVLQGATSGLPSPQIILFEEVETWDSSR